MAERGGTRKPWQQCHWGGDCRTLRLLLGRKCILDGELWGSGNVGTPRSSLINPELATVRVRINSRFKDLPGQLKGLSETNSMKALGRVQTSSSYKAGPGTRSQGSWWRKKAVGQGVAVPRGGLGGMPGHLPISPAALSPKAP